MDMITDQTGVSHPDPASAWSTIGVAQSVRERLVTQSAFALNLEEGEQDDGQEIVSVDHNLSFGYRMRRNGAGAWVNERRDGWWRIEP